VLPGLGGLLGAVERVEETGEGLGVGRQIVYPAKVPNRFARHIGLAEVIPIAQEVIVNADTVCASPRVARQKGRYVVRKAGVW
jgi:hypothetical protein